MNILKKPKFDNRFFRSLRDFYIRKLYFIVKRFKRSYFLSLVLIWIKYIEQALIIFNDPHLQEISNKETHFAFILKMNYLNNLISGKNVNQFIVIALLSLNCILVIYLIALQSIYIFQHTKQKDNKLKYSQQAIRQSRNYSQKLFSVKSIVFDTFSFIFMIYNYIFFIPSVYFSLLNIGTCEQFINLLLTLLIGVLVSDIDYEYSIQDRDFLKRKYNLYNLIEIIIFFFAFGLTNFKPNVTLIILCLLFCYQFVIQIWQNTFFVANISRLITFISIYFLMALICLITFAYFEFTTVNNILSLILLLLVPIAYQVSKILETIEIENIVNSLSQIEQAKTSQLSKIMRLTFFKNRKYTDSEGIKILNGISKLQPQEKQNFLIKTEANLPKQKNPNNLNTKTLKLNNEGEHYNISQKHTDSTDTNSNQLISEAEMNQLISLIGDCFRRQASEGKSSHENLVDLSYLIYLLEIQQNFKLFWKQYCYETSISNQTSIKREQMMYSLLHRFERNLNSIQRQEKYQESIFSVNYLNVIMYDESIKESFSLLNQCILKKTSILQMMQMRIIDLNILSQKIEELESQIEKLKSNIDFLHKLNGSNHEFTLLNTYYRNFLSFSRFDVQFDRYLPKNNRKKQNGDNHNQDFNYYQCKYKSSVNDISELQSKNSCIIFTSLLNSAVQKIKKTSINFCKIFKMRNELAINKPIEILMPIMFKIAHPKYVKEFMENKNVFNNRVQNVVFGIKNDGYIFPCTVNVKVNRIDLFNDFGMTTLVKMINQSKDYILFNEQNLRIISITKNIHKFIFQSYKKFHTIFIDTYFPFINHKNLKQQNDSQINCEGVCSMNNFDELSLNSNNQASYIQQQFSFVFIEDNSLTELVKCHQSSVLANVKFYLLDIEIKKAQYKYIDNVYYIEISQLQVLEPAKNFKIILQQLDSFLYESKRSSPIFKKILKQLKLMEQLSDDIQDNPFSIEHSSPRLFMSSLILKEHQKSSQEILEINSPTLKRLAKSKYETLDNQKQDSINTKNEFKFFSTEHNLESQSTGREYQLVKLSKKLRGVHSALQIFNSISDKNKISQQTQNTSRTVLNVNQILQTDHQKLITENQNLISSPQEQVKTIQQIKLFRSTKQPNLNKSIQVNKKNDPIIKINDKQSQIDFSIINTLGLNNSLSINAAEEMVTINSIVEDEKNDIQQQRLVQIEQDIQKEEKINQSRSTIRYIKDIMNQKIELNSIKLFQIVGISCFLTLLILSIVQYAQLLTSIKDFNLDFKLVNWPSTLQSQIASVQKNVSLNQINKQNDFVLVTKEMKSQLSSYINSFMIESVSQIHQTMMQMEGINSNRPIFYFLNDQPIVYSWPSFKYTGTQPDGKFYSVQYNTNLHYGIILINLQILRYMADVGGGEPEFFMMVNEIVFQDAFKEVQSRAIQQSNKILENIKNNLDNMLVITLILTTFCIGIQIPIYYFIQKERHKILYLFATFSTEITSKILIRLNSIYHQSHSTSMGLSTVFTKNYNNNFLNEQNEQNKQVQNQKKAQQNNEQLIKKQNISECKQLTRLDSSFLKKLFCIYLLMIIFPILNKIITTYYINQSINDSNDIVQIYQLKAQILDSLGMNYYSLILKLYPSLKPFKIDWYMDRLNQIIINNYNMGQEIQNLINSQRDSYNYKKDDYDSTFFPMFQDNICLILERKHQFNSSQQADECSTCFNKVLTQGIILSFQMMNEQLKDFYSFFQIPYNTTSYENERNHIFKTFDLYGFHRFSVFLIQSIDYLREFIISSHQEYYDFFFIFETIGLVYQLLVIIVFFLIEQIIFYQSINTKINKTKMQLKVIDIKSLLSNPFIINYFKKNVIK